jgi:hypothetical protein
MRFCCDAEKKKLLRTCSMLMVRFCSLVSSFQPGEERAKCGRRGTADNHDLHMAAQRLQLIGQRPEQQADRLISDLNVSERNRPR